MAHIFDLMSTVCGQINVLSDYYSGVDGVSIRNLPHLPNFIVVSVNRAEDTMPWIVKDPKEVSNIDIVTILDTGDPFTPIYMCVADNITQAIVDKVPIMVNYKGNKGPGVGYVIVVPKMVFGTDIDVEETAKLFKNLYFTLLDLDPNMQFKAEPAILRLYNSQKIRIYTYDLTMILVALGMANINMRSLFVMEEDRRPIDSFYTLSAFTPEEMPDDVRSSIYYILDEFCTDMDKLRDSVGSGKMLRTLLYKD